MRYLLLLLFTVLSIGLSAQYTFETDSCELVVKNGVTEIIRLDIPMLNYEAVSATGIKLVDVHGYRWSTNVGRMAAFATPADAVTWLDSIYLACNFPDAISNPSNQDTSSMTVFVDATHGDDATGQIGYPTLPFKTFEAAVTEAEIESALRIEIADGAYTITDTVEWDSMATGFVMVFDRGATLTGTVDPFFWAESSQIVIEGKGTFNNSSDNHICRVQETGSVWFSAAEMYGRCRMETNQPQYIDIEFVEGPATNPCMHFYPADGLLNLNPNSTRNKSTINIGKLTTARLGWFGDIEEHDVVVNIGTWTDEGGLSAVNSPIALVDTIIDSSLEFNIGYYERNGSLVGAATVCVEFRSSTNQVKMVRSDATFNFGTVLIGSTKDGAANTDNLLSANGSASTRFEDSNVNLNVGIFHATGGCGVWGMPTAPIYDNSNFRVHVMQMDTASGTLINFLGTSAVGNCDLVVSGDYKTSANDAISITAATDFRIFVQDAHIVSADHGINTDETVFIRNCAFVGQATSAVGSESGGAVTVYSISSVTDTAGTDANITVSPAAITVETGWE